MRRHHWYGGLLRFLSQANISTVYIYDIYISIYITTYIYIYMCIYIYTLDAWWKESWTSWYGKYSIIYKVLYIPGPRWCRISFIYIRIYIYILSSKLTWMAGKSPHVFHRKYIHSCLVGIFQPVFFPFSLFFRRSINFGKMPTKNPAQAAIRDTWHNASSPS